MIIKRNGAPETFLYGQPQLNSLSLGMAAYDGQIGMGSITVPGDIPAFGAGAWFAGDRISVYDDTDTWLLYTGFVMDHTRRRSPAEPTEIETTYQLMDVNRQLIGRRVVEWDRPEETASERLDAFIAAFLSDLTLDTTWVDTSAVTMPPKIYTGDGIMDLLADLILYTGKTLFLAPLTDTSFELHWHALTDGAVSGLGATDQPFNPSFIFGEPVVTFNGAIVVFEGTVVIFGSSSAMDVVPLRDPSVSYSASDVKNDYIVRNGVESVPQTNLASIEAHELGGLKFQAVLDYGGVNLATLQLIASTLLYTAAYAKTSYRCTLFNLTGAQVASLRPGSITIIESHVMALLGGGVLRVSQIDLSLSQDESGNPMPDWWDMALELDYPTRLPTAVVGYGGQTGDLGRLSRPKTWTNTRVGYDDPDIPVGSSTTVTAQLVDEDGVAVPVPDVTLNWDILQWSDEAETAATTDFSLDTATSVTDISGQATNIVTHDTDTGTIKWWVEAAP